MVVVAADCPGLLRDITEVFAGDKINVTGVDTQSATERCPAWITSTVKAADVGRLTSVLTQMARVPGVSDVRRP